jgi:hypothetical protein
MNIIRDIETHSGRINSDEGLTLTPLTRQNSNIQRTLIEMGFDINLTNKVLSLFQITSLETAIEYMIKSENKWNHPFVQTEDNIDTCIVCGDNSNTHTINLFRRGSLPDINLERNDPRELRRFSSHPIARNYHLKLDEVKIDIIPEVKGEICNICMGEIKNSYNKCSHKFCNDCVIDYIKNKINNSDVEKIGCPEGIDKCNSFFTEEDIKALVTRLDYQRYLKFKKRIEIYKIPNSVICPIANCESYAISNGDEKILTCLNNHQFCKECNQPPHNGVSCDKNLENYFKQWKGLAKFVRKCPKCKFLIQKNEGCNHMTCANRQCNYQFCWICMGTYDSDHFNNILSPCFGLQNTKQTNILSKLGFLRFFKMLIMFIIILLAACLGMIFFLIGIYIMISSKFEDKVKNAFKHKHQKFRKLIHYSTTVFLGFSLTSMSLLLVSIGIICLPLIVAIYAIVRLVK